MRDAALPTLSTFSFAILLALGAPAQEPASPSLSRRAIDPARFTPAAANASVFDRLLFDVDERGAQWVRGASYKASFDAEGATFIPFLGAQAPRNFPVSFRLESARCGPQDLRLERPFGAHREGERVAIDHGALAEVYLLGLDSIEQRFLLREPVGGGDLELALGVTTELLASAADGGGFVFRNQYGGVLYGRAEAFDSDGRRTAVRSTWKNGRIELVVPSEFVATAKYPLTVDPVISNFAVANQQIPGASGMHWLSPDVAYDWGWDIYVTTMEHAFSATDHDIYVQAFDSSAAPLGSLGTIDFSVLSWTEPKIASNRRTGSFLVVAERTLSGGATVIAGRLVTAPAPLSIGSIFQISGAEGGRNPDVGGDPGTSAPTYFCVCWEGGINGFSNIYYNIVQTNGLLNYPVSQYLGWAPTVTHDTRPSMSKSCGNAGQGTQTWIIVFERVGPGGDKDIYGALIHWDGTVIDQGFAIDASNESTTVPAVSSPTDEIGGIRKWMVVYQATQGRPPFGIIHEDLYAKVYYGTSAQPVPRMHSYLSQIFPSGPYHYDELNPCVDTDGCRFVVGYTEYVGPFYWDQGTPCLVTLHTDFDIAVAQTEYPFGLNLNAGVDDFLQITATNSGGGQRWRYFATWESHDTTSGDSTAEGALWEGVSAAVSGGPGSYFNVALPGCGGLALQASGFPALAGSFTISMTGVQSVPFLLIGFSVPPIELCPGCYLGVDPFTAVALQTDTLTLEVPCQGELVNQPFAFQGIDFGLGSGCPGVPSFSLSDEIIVTIL